MSPRKKRDDEEPRADQTEEYQLEDDQLEETDDQADDEELEDGDLDDNGYEDDGDEDDEPGDDEELDEEDSLEQVVSAETQEWDGLEAAEAEGEAEKTVVASAGDRVKQAGSSITSSFEKVGGAAGSTITSGFKAVRRHVGFPMWLRFLTASFVIVLAVAGATSASLILYLTDFADALKKNSIRQAIAEDLLPASTSGPQTFLIIGSDRRNGQISGKYGNSDTTMLLRLDPDKNAIALLSIPRDLKVNIPGYGTNKINAAYSFGGPKLTLETVKQITGLQINHLVNVDFTGFARAVNAIGCVYVDVDRRYYIPPNTGTSEINLQPGYQALCGFDALSYVRYRHTDTDIVRAARQQEFLRQARAKVPPTKIIDDRDKLLHIFAHYTSSDIDSSSQLLQLLRLFIDLRGAQVKEVHFDATLGPSYVYASEAKIHQSVNQFLGVEGTPGPAGSSAKPSKPVTTQRPPDFTKSRPAAKKKSSHPSTSLTRTTYGRQLAQGIKSRKLKVPVYYPTVLEDGSDYAQKPRVYKINGKGDGAPPHDQRAAYKYVFSLPGLGDYYGFMGTSWREPPILNDPSETRTIGDREYKLYYDGDRLRLVAWQTDQGSFWVSNSLIETISNPDLLKIAVGFRLLPGT
jgi:polyisoprenyl-teichoic acid--peptidoglycan teichoic acid transferase